MDYGAELLGLFSGNVMSASTDFDRWGAYRTPASSLRDLSLACLGAGEQAVDVPPPFEYRRLDCYALVVVSRGTGRYWATSGPRRRLQPVIAPALIWLFPDVLHGYAPDPTGWVEHWVMFTGVAAYGYEELGCWSRSQPVVRLDRSPPNLADTFVELRRSMQQLDRAGEIESGALVHRVIAQAVRQAAGDGLTPRQRGIVDDLRDRATSRASIPEHANRVGLSVYAYREAVRSTLGMTPSQFVLQVRLARAQALLAESGVSVGDVAAAVGYDDPAYFSRLFARHVGSSPRRFRDQQLQSRPRQEPGSNGPNE